jgi:hypothetical protein
MNLNDSIHFFVEEKISQHTVASMRQVSFCLKENHGTSTTVFWISFIDCILIQKKKNNSKAIHPIEKILLLVLKKFYNFHTKN